MATSLFHFFSLERKRKPVFFTSTPALEPILRGPLLAHHELLTSVCRASAQSFPRLLYRDAGSQRRSNGLRRNIFCKFGLIPKFFNRDGTLPAIAERIYVPCLAAFSVVALIRFRLDHHIKQNALSAYLGRIQRF